MSCEPVISSYYRWVLLKKQKNNIPLIDFVCAISRGRGSLSRQLMPELRKTPEAVTPPAYFVRQQNSSGTRSVKALTRLQTLADVVRKIKQEGHKNHENKQNIKKKKNYFKKWPGGCCWSPNKRPEPLLLESGLRRDSGTCTRQRFSPVKPWLDVEDHRSQSVLLIQLWVQQWEALEGAQQNKREAAASYTELYSVGWEQLRLPSSKLN